MSGRVSGGALARLAAGLLVAALVLLTLEGLLALFDIASPQRIESLLGFGPGPPLFVADPSRPALLRSNQETYGLRPQSFAARKPAGSLRIAIVGGSNVFNFGRHFQPLIRALQRQLGPRPVEVINGGVVGYGSARLAGVVEQLLGHDLDLLVFYEGHNEFEEHRLYAPLLSQQPALEAVRRSLRRWRLYLLLRSLWLRARPAALDPQEEQAARTGRLAAAVREDYRPLTDPDARDRIVAAYAGRLRWIARRSRAAGVPLLLCTAAANHLTPPFSPCAIRPLDGAQPQALDQARGRIERHARFLAGIDLARGEFFRLTRLLAAGAGDPSAGYSAAAHADFVELYAPLWNKPRASDADLEDWRAALALLEPLAAREMPDAEVWFLLGLARFRLGQYAASLEALERSETLDCSARKATPQINAALRRVAAEESATLCDVEAMIRRASVVGVPGWDLFTDHCHLNPKGRALLLLEVARAAAPILRRLDPRLSRAPERLENLSGSTESSKPR